jgi:lipoprotein-releasing system permease protein
VRWMNVFAFLGLFVGVFAWCAVSSIMRGLQGDIKNRILREKPHLLWEGTPREGLSSKEAALRAALGSDFAEVRFMLRTEGLLEIPSYNGAGRSSGSGVVIQGDDSVGRGTFRAGAELATVLGLATEVPYKLRSAWKLEQPPLEPRFESVFETGVYELDRTGVRVNAAELGSWLGLTDAVSRVELRVSDPERAEEFRARAEEALGVTFKTWKETDASLWYSLKIERICMNLAVFFIVVLATVAVNLALSVRVADKAREIGLLRGLGADSRVLARLYLYEGGGLGLVGAFLGVVGAWGFCRAVEVLYRLPDIYYSTQVPVDWRWGPALLIGAVAVGAALLASVGPARRVLRAEISDALRS